MSLMTQLDARLKATLPNFNTIEKARSLEMLENFNSQTPACLYYLAGIQSEASPYDAQDYQPGDRQVGIIIVCAVDDFDTRWKEVYDQVAGWQPTGGTYESLEHDTGDAIGIDGGFMWWRDIYAVRCFRGEI